MAFKVSKTTIYRVSVSITCTCSVTAEFGDVQCKESLTKSSFSACATHFGMPGVDLVELILRERLEEAVEAAQKTPIHLHSIQEIEEGDTGGVVAYGDSVQSVMKIKKASAVRARPDTGIKTLRRSPEQLAKAGATPIHAVAGASEMQIDEVAENSSVTPHIAELLDTLDTRDGESGLFEDAAPI